MTQIEAFIVVVSISVATCWGMSFLPDRFSIFHQKDAKLYFDVAVSTLLLFLWPVFSSETLVNRSGDKIFPFPFLNGILIVFIFFLFLAVVVEVKNKTKKVKKNNGFSTFITTLAWFLVVANLVSLISTGKAYIGASPEVVGAMKEQSTLPLAWQYIYLTTSSIINIICAVLIFKANSIGRLIFVGWASISFLVAFVTSLDKTSIIWSLVFYVIFAVILFSPKGDEYFSNVKQ